MQTHSVNIRLLILHELLFRYMFQTFCWIILRLMQYHLQLLNQYEFILFTQLVINFAILIHLKFNVHCQYLLIYLKLVYK
jgi:hypothetical protein